MMHSRAYLLLEREFRVFEETNIFGISVTPVGDSLMEWVAEIQGLKDSLWEGAELQLAMKYTEDYNRVPPSIRFTTIPFHPNVDPQSGKPCVDFLDDPTKWDPNLTMNSILLTIQVLLSNPVLNNAVNLEAAKMLQNHYPWYRQRVIQCVRASQHLGEGIPSTMRTSTASLKLYHTLEGSPGQVRNVLPEISLGVSNVTPDVWKSSSHEWLLCRNIRTISYEDYYLTWAEIATSKTAEHFKTPVLEDPNFIGNHYKWMATNVTEGEWDQNVHQFLISEIIEKQKKQNMFASHESIANLHMPSPTPVSKSQVTSHLSTKNKSQSQDEEPWEKEVEDLVMWSTNLDQERIDQV